MVANILVVALLALFFVTLTLSTATVLKQLAAMVAQKRSAST
jgi:hypothetical protein